MMQRLLVAAVVCCYLSTGAFAQTYSRENVYKMGHNTFENKVRKYVGRVPANVQARLKSNELFSGSSVSVTPEAESEIHAAINPTDTNNIIVAGMQFSEGGLLGAALTFPIYYTTDFGQTWKQSTFNAASIQGLVAGGGDPIITFDSKGTAYLSWLLVSIGFDFQFKNTLYWAKSTDGGATWVRSNNNIDQGILESASLDAGRFVDKEWLATDLSPSPYKDNIYVAYAEINLTDTTYNILVKVKKPGVDSFSTAVDLTPEELRFSQFTSIDVDSKGHVHVLFAGATETDDVLSIFHVKSIDGGTTFSKPVRISGITLPCFPPQPDVPCDVVGIDSTRVYPCPHMRVDKSGGVSDGNIYAVWTANGTNTEGTRGLDIYYSRSTDGGKTWQPAIILNNDGLQNNEQFYPSMAVNEQGVLVVTWYDRREDANNNLQTKYYMTYSTDGGTTFTRDFAVSNKASDFSQIGVGNSSFGIGEYTQVVCTANYAIPFWADGRTNDGNIEIFHAKVPLGNSLSTGIQSLGNLNPGFGLTIKSSNPTTDHLVFALNMTETEKITTRLLATDGKVVFSSVETMPAGSHTRNLQTLLLPAGNYWLVVESTRGIRTEHIVKQ